MLVAREELALSYPRTQVDGARPCNTRRDPYLSDLGGCLIKDSSAIFEFLEGVQRDTVPRRVEGNADG